MTPLAWHYWSHVKLSLMIAVTYCSAQHLCKIKKMCKELPCLFLMTGFSLCIFICSFPTWKLNVNVLCDSCRQTLLLMLHCCFCSVAQIRKRHGTTFNHQFNTIAAVLILTVAIHGREWLKFWGSKCVCVGENKSTHQILYLISMRDSQEVSGYRAMFPEQLSSCRSGLGNNNVILSTQLEDSRHSHCRCSLRILADYTGSRWW